MGDYAVISFFIGMVIISFCVGYVTAFIEGRDRLRATQAGTELITKVYDDMLSRYSMLVDTLLFQDKTPSPLLQQPDITPLDDLMLSYGVNRVEDLPDDVRRVWDRDYRDERLEG